MTDEPDYSWLTELQDRVGEWSAENFGTEQPSTYPLIGAGEEIGELTTSVLKQAQGIDDSDKYADRVGPDAERDAIGDIVIYLLDAAYRSPAPTGIASEIEYWNSQREGLFEHYDDPVGIIRQLYIEYGELNVCAIDTHIEGDDRDHLTADLASVIMVCERFARIRGYEFKQCVLDAWNEVSDRNWDSQLESHGR